MKYTRDEQGKVDIGGWLFLHAIGVFLAPFQLGYGLFEIIKTALTVDTTPGFEPDPVITKRGIDKFQEFTGQPFSALECSSRRDLKQSLATLCLTLHCIL